jgi:8-oxo-dGTP pyrophosphatase MutT (NUDIX family)
VVTCFLRRGGRVLVLKRSQRVGTHRGLWAGVSGYIERGEQPRETAFKELQEEVCARIGQLRLVREAPPLTFEDPPSGKVWTVHPFLFDDLGVDVHTDWEHTEHRWVRPEELGPLETVPCLKEALAAALGEGTTVRGTNGKTKGAP